MGEATTIKVERSFRVVGLTDRGTILVEEGGEVRDTNEEPREWVVDRADLRPGGVFDYYSGKEKEILRRGLPR